MAMDSMYSGRVRGLQAGERERREREEQLVSLQQAERENRLRQEDRNIEAHQRRLAEEDRITRNRNTQEDRAIRKKDRARSLQENEEDRKIAADKRTREAEDRKVKLEDEGRARDSSIRQEGMYSFIQGVYEGGDKAALIAEFNKSGKMQIKDFTLDPQGNIILVGVNGQTGKIPKNVGVDLYRRSYALSGVSRSVGKGATSSAYTKAVGLRAMGEHYDLASLEGDAHKRAALETGLAEGRTFGELAEVFKLPRKGAKPLQDLEAQRDAAKQVVEKYIKDKGSAGRRFEGLSAEYNRLNDAHKAAAEQWDANDPGGMRIGGLQGQEEASLGRGLQSEPEPHEGQTVMQKQDLDSNKDNKVDETDEIIKAALDAEANPDKYPDPVDREEAKAILKAFRKLKGEQADQTVRGFRHNSSRGPNPSTLFRVR